MNRGGVKIRLAIGLGITVIGLILLVSALVQSGQGTSVTTSQSSSPAYLTLLPAGKTITQLGGWDRVSPADSDPVYAYADRIGGVGISVSEQPLPAAFKENVDAQIAALAKSYNATDQLTAGGTTVYIGTNAKGPQSVILTKNNLLILIKSQQVIPDTSWKSYINSLH